MTGIDEQLNLNDRLALERTRLAEERTHLAYIRTGMSMILGGMFFIGYFPKDSFFSLAGYTTIALSLAFIGYGFYSHRKTHAAIKRLTLGMVDIRKK
jgi:putative membrane protein